MRKLYPKAKTYHRDKKNFIVLPEGIDIIGKMGESGYIINSGYLDREQLKAYT